MEKYLKYKQKYINRIVGGAQNVQLPPAPNGAIAVNDLIPGIRYIQYDTRRGLFHRLAPFFGINNDDDFPIFAQDNTHRVIINPDVYLFYNEETLLGDDNIIIRDEFGQVYTPENPANE